MDSSHDPSTSAINPHPILLVEVNAVATDLAERVGGALAPAPAVERAPSLPAAAQRLHDRSYESILIALDLADPRSLDSLRQARQIAGDHSIIVLSGPIDDGRYRAALRDGADDVLDLSELGPRMLARCIRHARERRAARAQHHQLELLLETTPDAIIVISPDGEVRYVNHAAVLLFGRGREELCAERLGFSVRDGDTTEIRILGASAHQVCEMRVVSIAWNHERAHLAVIRDRTDRARAEELRARAAELEQQNLKIEEANYLKSQFLAHMSHELRTPLNSIIGFSSLLHHGEVGPLSAEQRELLGDVLTSARHLLGLINEILDLAKVESGKLVLHPEPVVLSWHIAEVAEILRALAAPKGIEIRIDCAPEIDEVVLDPRRLHQVLYNYLSNAIKFSPPDGTVVVRTRADGEATFRLEVEDSGPGIPPDDLDKLFYEFQQLQLGGRQPVGTGLGLALTRRIVEAQGGSVGVSSEPGRGSVFSAVLPRSPDGGRAKDRPAG